MDDADTASQGFTLVELSIVLVVIGLLVGGAIHSIPRFYAAFALGSPLIGL